MWLCIDRGLIRRRACIGLVLTLCRLGVDIVFHMR